MKNKKQAIVASFSTLSGARSIARFLPLLVCVIMVGCTTAQADGSWLDKGKELLDNNSDADATGALSVGDISAGLKEALKVGTAKVVGQLGKPDGFNTDSAIHIPLPEKLQSARKWLNKAGAGDRLDELELQLNRAAEAATPKAKELFITAISEMSIEDAKKIYSGPANSATEYFKSKMTAPLQEEMRPVVGASLAEVGAVKNYDKIMGKYESLPFAPDMKSSLTDYAVAKGMDGIFYYLAQEEADIRANPAARTTELLKQVFGAKQ